MEGAFYDDAQAVYGFAHVGIPTDEIDVGCSCKIA